MFTDTDRINWFYVAPKTVETHPCAKLSVEYGRTMLMEKEYGWNQRDVCRQRVGIGFGQEAQYSLFIRGWTKGKPNRQKQN